MAKPLRIITEVIHGQVAALIGFSLLFPSLCGNAYFN
jgi:hypothetical protein